MTFDFLSDHFLVELARSLLSQISVLCLTLLLFVPFFSSLNPTTCSPTGTTYLATIHMASFVLVLSATLAQRPRASQRNSRASNHPWQRWRETFACLFFETTWCLEVRCSGEPWSLITSDKAVSSVQLSACACACACKSGPLSCWTCWLHW